MGNALGFSLEYVKIPQGSTLKEKCIELQNVEVQYRKELDMLKFFEGKAVEFNNQMQHNGHTRGVSEFPNAAWYFDNANQMSYVFRSKLRERGARLEELVSCIGRSKRVLNDIPYYGRYGGKESRPLAQWWSRRLITVRSLVRTQ